MSTKNNIPHDKNIYNFILILGLNLYLTLPQLKHFYEFILASSSRSYTGKLIEIAELNYCGSHRTTISRFFNNSTWNDDYVARAIKKYTIEKIWTNAQDTGLPIFVIIDDTLCKKTKPSSQARKPIQQCGFHFSHTEGKVVYGHQVLGVILQCGTLTLPLDFILHENALDHRGEKITKISQAMKIINSLPTTTAKVYVMADSWYSAEKLIKATVKKGFEYLGALKTNRVIYPKQHRMNHKISGYAKLIAKKDFDLVTVKKHKYYVHRYEGKINGFKQVVILLSYPEKSFGKEGSLKSFITTDMTMATPDILTLYTSRWSIEIFFRQNKMDLGLDNYQIRSIKAIKRFWILSQIAYLYHCYGISHSSAVPFSEGIKKGRQNAEITRLEWVIQQVQHGVEKRSIFKSLGLSQDKCA